MLNGKTVAVVVPAYNEEKQIGMVIETMPDFVDRIIVVDDCSDDNTRGRVSDYFSTGQNNSDIPFEKSVLTRTYYNEADQIAEALNNRDHELFPPSEIINRHPDTDRIILIVQERNSGVGGAIATGYKWARDHEAGCTAVMAGDGQMAPDELMSICMPVIKEEVDYVKGNRLIHRSAGISIPRTRFFGNSVLSLITKIASGYWRISDTQTGYTAISLNALRALRLHDIYRKYGMPNDMLVKLNMAYCTIREVPIRPVYRIGEQSKMKVKKVIPRISWLLFKSFFKRLWIKYFFKDFHPLFILYNMSFILFLVSIPFAVRILKYLFSDVTGDKPVLNSLMFMFLIVSATQSLLFAMWMDIQDNERLYK